MMETVAKTEHYTVAVDRQKNRLYLTGRGFWKNVTLASNYMDEIMRAVQRLSPGFTVLADLREFKTPPLEVGDMIIMSQKRVFEIGIGKSAQVVGKNVAIEMPMYRYAKTSGIQPQNRSFATLEEAEAWLDQA